MKRWQYWGKKTLCNLNNKTTFYIGNFCFPLCYRCCSIIICSIVGIFILRNMQYSSLLGIIFAFLFILPCYIDGVLQYRYNYDSTNARRIITGSLAGFGLAIIYREIIKYFIS